MKEAFLSKKFNQASLHMIDPEEKFIPTPHPVLKLPTREQAMTMEPEALRELLIHREELIAAEKADPFRSGFYLDTWKDADAEMAKQLLLLALFGGNGSAKTFFMCRKGVEVMLEKPGSKVLWLHEAEKPSILLHHATVYHYLPRELKVSTTRRDRVRKINYTVATGFSDGKFVMPNGSIGVFGAYKQDIADYEGTGWTLICADENLPLGWLLTLMYRLPRCKGQMIWGFSPIKGITPAVRHLTKGAVTVKSMPAPLLPQDKIHVPDCPAGHMPYIQRAVWPDTMLMYFPSSANPFGEYERMAKLAVGKPTTEIETRFYGYARNVVGGCFPKFSAVHILKRERVAEILAGKGTRRHIMDPAGSRNFFQLWSFTDEHGRRFITREWPDVPTYGEWAVTAEDSKRWDGDPGPAQPALGFGTIDYKRQILECEGNKFADGKWDMCGEKIFERLIDPRSGKAGALTEDEGGVSIMDMMEDENLDDQGRIVGPSLTFDQAPGLTEDQGIMRINDLLAYNEQERLCHLINEPKLFVSEDCVNLIWALQTYTRHDGEKAACKDPIDCLRYFVTWDSDYVDDASQQAKGGGSY